MAPKFEYKPTIPITGTHVQAKEKLDEKLKYFRKRLEVFRSNRNAVTNKDRKHQGYTVGQNCLHVQPKWKPGYKLAVEKFNATLLVH